MKNKKAVMGQIISVFVLILVVAILAGLTFLFISSLKVNVASSAAATWTTSGEADNILYHVALTNNESWAGYQLSAARNDPLSRGWSITDIYNATMHYGITNVTVNGSGYIVNSSTFRIVDAGARVNYTYISAAGTPAYTAINSTENSGVTFVNYLPLIFLALIFGAILTLVLKIILPYINIGHTMGGF
jgi:hypothetical protein